MRSQLTLVDIGASGGIHPRWKFLSDSDLYVIGFEPDEREFKNLPQKKNQHWFNQGLSDKKQKEIIYITNWQTNTSLFKPNFTLINHLSLKENDFKIVQEIEIPCDSLDNILNKKDINADILKIDTQGSELKILKGAKKQLLNSIIAVECEVEFVELYKNQPLFSDLDKYMHSLGFQLLDLGNFCYIKGKKSRGIGGQKGQLISADALYIKPVNKIIDLINYSSNSENKLIKFKNICLAYGYPDYVIEVTERLDDCKISNLILDCLTKQMKDFKIRSGMPSFYGKGFLSRFFDKLRWCFEEYRDGHWLFPIGNKD